MSIKLIYLFKCAELQVAAWQNFESKPTIMVIKCCYCVPAFISYLKVNKVIASGEHILFAIFDDLTILKAKSMRFLNRQCIIQFLAKCLRSYAHK